MSSETFNADEISHTWTSRLQILGGDTNHGDQVSQSELRLRHNMSRDM